MNFKSLVASTLLVGTVFISGCSNNSSSAPATPVPAASISITSLSSSTPMALTPLTISTSGINPSQAVAVMLSNTSGFSAVLTPIHVQSDGTVVVAMPVFIDPATSKTGTLAASLSIGQGGLTSAPVSITIQDIPPLSNYQTTSGPVTLGQISHAFYNYQAIALGQTIDSLQAIQTSPGNKIDVSVPMAHVQQQLTSVIEARNDIDRVITNNALQIGGGALANGTPITFDRNSVEIMDRALAVYLVNLVQPSLAATIPNAKRSLATQQTSADLSAAIDITSIFKTIEGAANVENIAGAMRGFADSHSTVRDKLVAVAGGLVAGATVVGLVVGSEAIVAGAGVVGLAVTAVNVANDLYNSAVNLNDLLRLNNEGASPAQLSQAQTALKDSTLVLGLDSLGGVLAGLGTVATTVEKMGIQAAGLVVSTLQLYAQNTQINDQKNADAAAAQLTAPLSSTTQGFGTLEGQVNISNSQGPILSGLTQVVILDPVTGTMLSVMADANGNYEILVPLDSPLFNYSSLTIEAIDPVSGIVLSSLTINLSGLTSSSTPFPAPTLTGVCTDTDANAPDSDDPDCD